MAYFLAGVGNAEILKDGELFATAKTLTDSSITIGVSAEDIRAGQGAKLYGKYFHTSTFDLKMTDAMFKLEYIAANIGSEIEIGGEVFTDESVIVTDGKLKVKGTPKPFTSGGKIYVHYRKETEDTYVSKEYTSEGITVPNGKYCVKYLYTNESARRLTVKANFTPDTLSVILTSNLYAGDDKNPATGTKIGTVTIKIPRFLLSGSQELSMNMTGASTTPFEGSALASNAEGCDGEGIYAEIIEVIDNSKWWGNGIKEVFIENANDLYSGDVLNIYIRTNNNEIKRIPSLGKDGYVDTDGVIDLENIENCSDFCKIIEDNDGSILNDQGKIKSWEECDDSSSLPVNMTDLKQGWNSTEITILILWKYGTNADFKYHIIPCNIFLK